MGGLKGATNKIAGQQEITIKNYWISFKLVEKSKGLRRSPSMLDVSGTEAFLGDAGGERELTAEKGTVSTSERNSSLIMTWPETFLIFSSLVLPGPVTELKMFQLEARSRDPEIGILTSDLVSLCKALGQ